MTNSHIFCLVDSGGHVHVKDGATSHLEVAAQDGLDVGACEAYRFDLTARRPLVDRGRAASDRAAQAYWDEHVDSPDKLMAFAAQGHLTKHALEPLLDSGTAQVYRDACRVIERRYTAECTATNDPCLASGCALDGEICLEPLLRAGIAYHQACGAAWSALFKDPSHRSEVWMR
jgi:hypothetical protein